MSRKNFRKPVIVSDYVHIYKPQPDVYEGVETESFHAGQRYEEWIVNDFTKLRDGDCWHLFGITHPRPKGFVNAYEFGADVHEAEYQLFHCSARGKKFSDVFAEGAFAEEKKILYPAQRPGERQEIWAPHADKLGDEFYMIYSPEVFRYAKSIDLKNWKTGFSFFRRENGSARDPFLFHDDNGDMYLIFCEDRAVRYRKTRDCAHWEEAKVLQTNPFAGGESESPSMLKRNGVYYLIWCLYDGRNGCYDNRTFVFASETMDGFEGIAPLTMLEAHAPVFVEDGEETYLLSVFHPNNGVSAAKIEWK